MAKIYLIHPSDGTSPSEREPQEGHWYTGHYANGQVGALAKYTGGYFFNSMIEEPPGVLMEQYTYLTARPRF